MNPPPSRGQIRGIDHVALAIPPCPKGETERIAEAFYGEALGLRRVPEPADAGASSPEGCWFEGPGVAIYLGVDEAFTPARKSHPALVVDDLDGVLERVVEAGGQVQMVGRASDGENADSAGAGDGDRAPASPRRAHVDDPFGNRTSWSRCRVRPPRCSRCWPTAPSTPSR